MVNGPRKFVEVIDGENHVARWNVRVDLVFRPGDRDDSAVQAIRRAIG